jgi:hypothetical protein
MSIVNKLKNLMLNEALTHKPYNEMTKSEFNTFRKKNFEALNKWKLNYILLFIKNFKHIFPEGIINLKKNDKGFALKDLKEDQILDAWSFNQKRPKEYMFDTSDLGKEVDPDSFFMNVLDWTAAFAPRSIDTKMEQVRDIIIKRIDNEIISGKTPFDITIIGEDDDLEKEGFFDRYPNLK